VTIHDRPARRDPLAEYDLLFRKVPKRLGFVEACRAVPGLFNRFQKRVPGEMFVLVGEDVVEVACPCGADPPPRVKFNVATPCDERALEKHPPELRCDRWFFFDSREVRVAREAAPESPVH
jgi:hypothetical protein